MTTKEDTSGVVEEAFSGRPERLGVRHLQILLMFFGIALAFALRVAMSVAIVAMADSSAANPDFEEYDWNEGTRSIILSSFFWGYTIMQIPSGYIAQTWSGRKLLSLGMFICGVTNLAIPLSAKYGDWGAVCACRLIMGLSQACVYPSFHTLLPKWVPPEERARLGTFTYAGAQFGTVVALPVSGVLAASVIGWPSIFYIFGIATVLWSTVFFFCSADSPAMHSCISIPERQYIEKAVGISRKDDGSEQVLQRKLPIPWKSIFTSLPMWALIIAHCGQNWGFWMLITELPTYMKAVLHFDIAKNGVISALPYLAMWILSFPASWLSDYVLRKGISRAVARKVSNTIGHWGPAVALIGLCFVTNDQTTLAVIILIIAVGLNAGSICGYQINHMDLSPNFSGTMMSITNCLASVVAILAPLISGIIVTDEANVVQWNIVFIVSAAIYFLGNLIFILFGKAEVQWWNDPEVVKDRR